MTLTNHLSALGKPDRGLATKVEDRYSVAANVRRFTDYPYTDTDNEHPEYLGHQHPNLNNIRWSKYYGWVLF